MLFRSLHIRAVNRSIKTAVIVGFVAAYIHGIPTLNKEKCLVVCLNLPGDRHPPSSTQCTEIMHYRDAALPESDITEVHGKRVTTIERTFVDFCVMYDELESLAFVEAAMRKGSSHEQFQEYLHEHAGQRGVAKAQRILDRAYDIIDSVQETSMRYQIEAQFPTHKISPQVVIGNYRVDHLMDDYIIIELDGRVKYTEEFAWENGTTVTEIFRKQVSRERYLLSICIKDLQDKIEDDEQKKELNINTVLLQELKNFEPYDNIAIIARTNAELSKIANLLENEKIPYILNNEKDISEYSGIFECFELLKYLVYENELKIGRAHV